MEAIAAAVKSDEPLLPNAAAQSRLEAEVNRISAALPAMPVPGLSSTAQGINGQTYLLDAGWLGYSSLALTFKGDEALLSLAGERGRLDLPVGLDNNYRLVPNGDFGLPAGLRGSWKSADTFVLNFNTIGNINNYEMSMKFRKDRVDLHLEDFTGKPMPESATATGVLAGEGRQAPVFRPEKMLLEWPDPQKG